MRKGFSSRLIHSLFSEHLRNIEMFLDSPATTTKTIEKQIHKFWFTHLLMTNADFSVQYLYINASRFGNKILCENNKNIYLGEHCARVMGQEAVEKGIETEIVNYFPCKLFERPLFPLQNFSPTNFNTLRYYHQHHFHIINWPIMLTTI